MSQQASPPGRRPEVIDLTGEDDESADESPIRASGLTFREVNGVIELEDSPSPPGRPHSIPSSPAKSQAREASAPSDVDPSQSSHSNTPSRAIHDPMDFGEPQIKISPKPLEPPKRRTPEPARQRSLPRISAATPLIESDSEHSDQQNADQQQTAPGTPSKSSSQGKRREKSPPVSTVNTNSPLIPRLRVKKARMEGQLPSVEDLVASLEGFKEAMEDDHRTATYWKLHDAKLAIEDAPPSEFDEKTDPFASMTSAVYTQGNPLPPNSVKEVAEYFTFSKAGKASKKRISLVATSFNDGARRLPNYQSHTNVRRNILTADDETLKYIPYMGDQPKDSKHDQLMQELRDQYVTGRNEDIQDFERATKLRAWLTSWLESLDIGLDQQKLKNYVLSLPGIDEKLRIKDTELDMIRKYSGYPLDTATKAMSKIFYEAFHHVFEVRLEKVVLPKDQLKEMMDKALTKRIGPSPQKPYSVGFKRLGTFVELTCFICGVVDCPTHGEFEDKNLSDQDSDDNQEEESPRISMSQRPKAPEKKHEQFNQRQHSDLALPYTDTLARYLSQKRTRPEEPPLKDSGPCSEECYMVNQYSDRVYQLDQAAIAAIPDMLITLTDPRYQSCHIAFSLNVPCWQIHAEVTKYLRSNPSDIYTTPVSTGRTKRPDWYDSKKKTLTGNWKDLTDVHLHQKRFNSIACGHDGPCTADCPCVERNILCERFCCCGDDCPRRFTGCSCHALGINCVSEHCICIAMNRECGPECASCGAIERIDPVNKYTDALFATKCQNVALQRGVSKKLVMGESELEGAGFGLYLLEPVKKGEFLSEYTGEVISHAEAERRGIIYDRKLVSFLFDLNASHVIDAARLGNKTRFINHSDDPDPPGGGPGLNCEAKIVLVNGQHRIKFIALRDIEPGTELLFNYGREFAKKHGLTLKIPSAKAGNKGVLVGEEALDALDGVTSRAKLVRGEMKAGRGRGGGGGGGKGGRKAASKSAPKPKLAKDQQEPEMDPLQEVLSHPIPDDDDEDDEDYGSPMEEDEDADESEEDDDEPKLKRKTRRPARYTR